MRLLWALVAASCATPPRIHESLCLEQRRVLHLLLEQPLAPHDRDQIRARLDSQSCPTNP